MDKSIFRIAIDARRAEKKGPDALLERRRQRLAELVSFARTRSAFYKELYHRLPEHIENPEFLPVITKKELMADFNNWVTDNRITYEKTRAFLNDPERIGERFLGKYLLTATSGTTGYRGIFLLDNRSRAINSAIGTRKLIKWFTYGDLLKLLVRGLRTAAVIATDDHLYGYAFLRQQQIYRRPLGRIMHILSLHSPLPDLVDQLNTLSPAVLLGYACTIAQLAAEQKAERLKIRPVLILVTGEMILDSEYEEIARAFHTKIRNYYLTTEAPELSYGCEYGWHHINSDWYIFEPVNKDYSPTPPGEASHTVLLTNLTNRVQPILRYDLGDSVRQRSCPCPCGSPLPAVRVRGRTAEVLVFPGQKGGQVEIAPLVFSTLLDRFRSIELYQIVQTSPGTLRLRLRLEEDADPEGVWNRVFEKITDLLRAHETGDIEIQLSQEPPVPTPAGKYPTVIPFKTE